MPRLRHIAFIAIEPHRLYEFYHGLFGLEKVRTGPMGTVHVNDGLVDLAFLLQTINASEVVGTHRADGHEVDQTQGIHHFGFHTGNLDDVLARLGDAVSRGHTPQNGRPAEMRVTDPWGNRFDISSRGYFGREEKKLPGIRFLAVQTPVPEKTAELYQSSFDLKKVGRTNKDTVYLSDDDVVLGLMKEQIIGRPGAQYFGVQVNNLAEIGERLKQVGLSLPAPNSDGEIRMTDPEGNLFVVSEAGWQA